MTVCLPHPAFVPSRPPAYWTVLPTHIQHIRVGLHSQFHDSVISGNNISDPHKCALLIGHLSVQSSWQPRLTVTPDLGKRHSSLWGGEEAEGQRRQFWFLRLLLGPKVPSVITIFHFYHSEIILKLFQESRTKDWMLWPYYSSHLENNKNYYGSYEPRTKKYLCNSITGMDSGNTNYDSSDRNLLLVYLKTLFPLNYVTCCLKPPHKVY